MFDLDHWREILNALGSNKLRTFLTAFGVFWGIFLLMIMLGSGTGLANGIIDGFGDGATNTFFVWTRSTSVPYKGLPPGRSFELDNGDFTALREQIVEASAICPRNQLGGFRTGNNVMRGDKSGGFNVMGDVPEIQAIEAVRMLKGRFLNRLDLEEKRKIAVIGSRVVELLFEPDEEPIGDSIQINGVYFKVVGTFQATSQGDESDRDNQTIFIPFTTFQQAFNYGDQVGWFAITSVPGVPASKAEERTLALLKRRHSVAPEDDRAFGHFNLEEEYNQVQGLFAGIGLLIWIVGIGTLTAGVIGVSNIMLVIVRERTRELGIRRAIGATPLKIMAQIVTEAVLLTSVAGYAGLIAGIVLVDFIASTLEASGANMEMFANPSVSLDSAMKALLVLVIAGTAAGLLPARRAIRVSPVIALRAD